MDTWPTDQQLQGCHLAARRSRWPLAVAFASPRSTTEVTEGVDCVRPPPRRGGRWQRLRQWQPGYCDCFVDLTFAATAKNSQGRTSRRPDATRCDAVGRYWAATRSYLTRRQFDGIGTAPPPTEQQQREAFTRRACRDIRAMRPSTMRGLASTVGADPPECMIGPGGCVCAWQFFTVQGPRKITGVAEARRRLQEPARDSSDGPGEVGGGKGDVVDVPYDLVQAGFKDGTYAFLESRAAGTHQGARAAVWCRLPQGTYRRRSNSAGPSRRRRSGSTPTSKPDTRSSCREIGSSVALPRLARSTSIQSR